jgi:hypothetical protein
MENVNHIVLKCLSDAETSKHAEEQINGALTHSKAILEKR